MKNRQLYSKYGQILKDTKLDTKSAENGQEMDRK